MKPHVICHMMSSLDGSLSPSRYTTSPDGERVGWSKTYEALHDMFGGDAWLVGRVTMAEISKAAAHPPVDPGTPPRPLHVADHDATRYAVALDPSGKVHFDSGDLDGDHVVVLLGADVSDAHLAELAADGVSYVVGAGGDIDLAAMLETLSTAFGIRRLLLEGGARINGALLAAGLVDELSVLVAPALDAKPDAPAIVDAGASGLAGYVALSLVSAETLDGGTVHLRYAVGRG
jgi:riboflavin biosynthesis pyrimidine reductase